MKYIVILTLFLSGISAADSSLLKFSNIIAAIQEKDELKLFAALKNIEYEYSYSPGEGGVGRKNADIKTLLGESIKMPDKYEIQVSGNTIQTGWRTDAHIVHTLKLESRGDKLVFYYGQRNDRNK